MTLAALTLSLFALAVSQLDQELQYLQGLQARSLFRLAELHGERLLAQPEFADDPKKPSESRSQVMIAVVQAYTAHALNSPREQRRQQWGQLEQFVNQYQPTVPSESGKVLVQLQAALGRLSRAELARQEAEVVAKADFADALQQLRTVVRELEAVDAMLQDPRWWATARKSNASFDELERNHVRNKVHFHLAQALRNQGLCYPAGSVDHVNSLAQAKQLLAPLARLKSEDPIVAQSEFDLMVIDRLLGNFAEAAARMKSLVSSDSPQLAPAAILAERVHWLLDQQQLEQALQVAAAAFSEQPHVNPELDLAWLAALIARLQQSAASSTESVAWQSQAARLAAEIGKRHGVYWGHRANIQLARIVGEASSQPSSLELLRQTAESFVSRSLPDEAVDAYLRAAEQATVLQRPDLAFEFSYKAALVDHQRQRWPAAIRQLGAASLAFPQIAGAAEAHLLAVFDVSQWLRELEGTAGAVVKIDEAIEIEQIQNAQQGLKLYRQMLLEQLDAWPDDEATSDKARAWLGRLYESQAEWQAAVAVYQEMSPTADTSLGRLDRLAESYRRWFAATELAQRAPIVLQARQWFDQRATALDGDVVVPATAARAAVTAAWLYLAEQPTDVRIAEQRLRAVVALVEREPAANDDSLLGSRARCLLAVALGGQGKWNDAVRVVQSTEANDQEALREALLLARETIDRQWPERQAGWHDVLQELLSQFTLRLRETQVTDADRLLADSLQADGRNLVADEAAIGDYEALARRFPNDARIQMRLAQVLLTSDTVAHQAEALRQWRIVAQRTRPVTDAWFQAKYGLAAAHFRRGDKQQARDIIRLTQSLHPAMGGDKLKAQFMQLLNQCEQ